MSRVKHGEGDKVVAARQLTESQRLWLCTIVLSRLRWLSICIRHQLYICTMHGVTAARCHVTGSRIGVHSSMQPAR